MKRLEWMMFAVILLWTGFADATTVVELKLEDLLELSDAVIVGDVRSADAFVEDGRVHTRIRVDVAEVWKGTPDKTVEIVHMGGRTEERATIVHGMPAFLAGERVLVFLEQPNGLSHYVVTGLTQGKYLIEALPDGGSLVVPQVDLGSVAKREKVPDNSVQLQPVTSGLLHGQRLVDFRARVSALVEAQAEERKP